MTHPVWPHDNQEARNAFYGDPGKGQIPSQMVPVVPPFAMYYEKRKIKNIQFHKKAAPYLLAALNEIWDYCQHDQTKIDAYGCSDYNGAYNHRMVRGSSTKWSNHAYATAIDLDASHNPLGATKGTMPQFVVDAFCRQGAMWGGWYQGRKDLMHFEFVDNGGRVPTTPPPVYHPPLPTFLVPSAPPAPADEFEDDEPTAPTPTAPTPVTPILAPVDGMVTGDPELFSVQKRLKARNYSPGLLDGIWGSGTAGALGGFINDRGGKIAVPASQDAFDTVREAIKAELSRAEAEGWFRPVTPDRAAGNMNTVAAVAPEVVPVHRNFIATAWASATAFFAGIYNTLSDRISAAWDWFNDNKDSIPSDDSGILHTVWAYVSTLPASFWIFAAAAGLAFLAINSRSGVNKITESVQTGARQ